MKTPVKQSSLPVWGEWIEISEVKAKLEQNVKSLPVWGEWIEISRFSEKISKASCLSPCGESGLKSVSGQMVVVEIESLPVWGEWIEIISPGQR